MSISKSISTLTRIFVINKSLCIILSLILIVQNVFCQNFSLPEIPTYDSISIDSYKEKVKEKTYFLEGNRVFEKGFNSGSMLYTPFGHLGGAKEDSCYTYFNGPDQDHFDVYYISDEYIINEKFSEDSKIFKHKKFNWQNEVFEIGEYYLIKGMYTRTITHSTKYKIGQWIKYDSTGQVLETIDYDHFTLDSKPIQFEGSLAITDSLKALADKRVMDIYGKEFYSKHIRFNPDRSGYYPYQNASPSVPGGYSLLKETNEEIYFMDFSYDIILGNERFNVIHLRTTVDGEFLGSTYFQNYLTKHHYLSKGLDSLNNGKFHANIKNWKKLAWDNQFDVTSVDFNLRFDFEHTSDFYGNLRLVIEQIIEPKEYPPYKRRQIIINAWTGEMKESIANEQETVAEPID